MAECRIAMAACVPSEIINLAFMLGELPLELTATVFDVC